MHGPGHANQVQQHVVDGQPLTFFVEKTISVGVVIMIVMVIVPAPVTATVYGGYGIKPVGAGAYLSVGIGHAVTQLNGADMLLTQAIKLALFPQ